MKPLTDSTRSKLVAFVGGQIADQDFEHWLYSAPGLEDELGSGAYLDLVGMDFSKPIDIAAARELAATLYAARQGYSIELDRALLVLRAMIAGECSYRVGTKILADLRLAGHEFIPAVFAGYSSEIERLGTAEHYQERILMDAKKLIAEIEDLTTRPGQA